MISCPHRPPCPGCPRFGELGISPAARSSLDELARAHGLSAIQVESGTTEGFRLRARLAIRGRVGSPKIGLFEAGTHRVVHVPSCRVHHPLINRVAAVVRRALVETHLTCYSDAAHAGLARYLQVTVERSSQTAQLVFVANCASPEPVAACLNLIRDQLGRDLHSLWFNSNCERSNTILGPDFQNWHGPSSIIENFGGADVHYPPGAFGQSNLDTAQLIIGHVRGEIPEATRIAEFYAGTGAIGLSILEKVSKIRMNEIGPQSLHGLEMGLAQLKIADRAKVLVVPGPAAHSHTIACDMQVVIVDPPRKGLDAELAQYLSGQPPERLVYVSCAVGSLLRDAAQLTQGGKLRLNALTAFNLLPFTNHVETVARFDRT
jgi:tRNA/tmRNA/rRNA uracil-C5-methylase (TrmA/RlmC/RlmD family)